MFFAVTIGTDENALFDFLADPLPATGQSVLRDAEIFSAIRVMEIKRFTAPIVATF